MWIDGAPHRALLSFRPHYRLRQDFEAKRRGEIDFINGMVQTVYFLHDRYNNFLKLSGSISVIAASPFLRQASDENTFRKPVVAKKSSVDSRLTPQGLSIFPGVPASPVGCRGFAWTLLAAVMLHKEFIGTAGTIQYICLYTGLGTCGRTCRHTLLMHPSIHMSMPMPAFMSIRMSMHRCLSSPRRSA